MWHLNQPRLSASILYRNLDLKNYRRNGKICKTIRIHLSFPCFSLFWLPFSYSSTFTSHYRALSGPLPHRVILVKTIRIYSVTSRRRIYLTTPPFSPATPTTLKVTVVKRFCSLFFGTPGGHHCISCFCFFCCIQMKGSAPCGPDSNFSRFFGGECFDQTSHSKPASLHSHSPHR